MKTTVVRKKPSNGGKKKKMRSKKTKAEEENAKSETASSFSIPENICSLFLTQGTLDIVVLTEEKEKGKEENEKQNEEEETSLSSSSSSSSSSPSSSPLSSSQLFEVKKCEVLKDVRFRGAISDFYCMKEQLVTEEKKNETVFNQQTFVLRRNEDDKYGDGNNFELALTEELGEMWKKENEEKKAEEKAKAKKTYIFEYEPKLWVDLGSALEMEMEKKRENEGESDDDINNNQNTDQDGEDEDNNESDTFFIAHDFGIQSTAKLETKSVQVSPPSRADRSLQYQFRTYKSDGLDSEQVVNSKKLEFFLKSCEPYVEECLKENESFDILQTELESLMV